MTTTSSKVAHFSEVTADRIRPQTIQVVEVREQDLKELPSGREQALAFEKTRKTNFWFFNGPVNFDEPRLPEIGVEMDGSLLPPRQP